MAVEGLQSRARDPLADALLLHALRLLREYLPRLETEPGNAEIRVGLMVGALLAGQGTDYTGSGLNAALTHPIGARFHAENGIVNAVLLPWTMRFNTPVAGERLALVAEALGAATRDVDAAINAVEALFARLGVPRRLRDVGVAEDAIPQIASDAAEDFFFHQNPRRIEDPGEVVGLLRSAW
jgi:alcohol dehydrogenase class IV